eukprot:7207640-Pyramimonas_sp.AAC.1
MPDELPSDIPLQASMILRNGEGEMGRLLADSRKLDQFRLLFRANTADCLCLLYTSPSPRDRSLS